MEFDIHVTLKSDTTFGQGTGIAGRINTEAWYEPDTGLPLIPGKSFRGLLVQSCGEILSLLKSQEQYAGWEAAAQFLFGEEGSGQHSEGALIPANLTIHEGLRRLVTDALGLTGNQNNTLNKHDFWKAYTTTRTQTAISDATEAQADKSLRTRRLVKRGTQFYSTWRLDNTPNNYAKALLYAGIAGIRRGGVRRNRGSGKLSCTIDPAHAECKAMQQAFTTLFQ